MSDFPLRKDFLVLSKRSGSIGGSWRLDGFCGPKTGILMWVVELQR
jgi:hypothetical protein